VNIKDYISTGIIEAYVLGNLDPKERREVLANLARYPELKKELAEAEKTLEQLVIRAAKNPRHEVKARLMASLSENKQARVIPLQSAQTWKYATAASLVLAVTSAVLAYTFWNNWKNAEMNFNNLVAQNQQIASDYNTVNQRLDKIESDLKVYDNPSFRKVIMKGTPSSPGAMASVYWNETSQEVYLSIQSLKELSNEQQYQLWAMVDGEPHDMGVFNSDVAGLIKMKPGTDIDAFAVTIEPRGGKPSPTLETMQVVGKT
jgi:anti-sigma-K factor RskA